MLNIQTNHTGDLQSNLEAIVTPTTEKDNDWTTDEAKTIYIPVIEMTNKLIAEYLPVKILVEDLSKPGENGLVEALFGLDLTRPCPTGGGDSCGRTFDVIFLWNFIFF
jgi:hypothetical protein